MNIENTTDHRRLTIRPTDADLAHLAVIGAALRAAGQPFANRTDAIRYALSSVAATVVAPAEDAQ